MESNPTTPFIPPMPDLYNGRSHPNSPVRPPVIPSSPASAQGGPPPPGFPPYNSGGYAPAPALQHQFLSPYGSSPGYIPSPMMPGSYYMPNVQLPDSRAVPPGGTPRAPPGPPPPGHGPPPSGPPPGFSADWTGYPPPPPPQPHQTPPWGPGPSPWAPPAPQLHPYTTYNTFQQPLPGAYPQQYPGQPQQYPGQPQQYPGQPQQYPGQPQQYPGQPQQYLGQWGPPVGAPYTTPAMGYGGQLPPQAPGWYGGAPPGFGPPPPQAAPARATRIARADRGDLIGRFAAGPHYGPVLKPTLVHRMRAELFVNPLLLPQEGEGDSERAHLKWNMLFSTAHCQRSTDPPHKSWSAGRQEPATFPRVSHLRLISRTVPWMIDIRASNPPLGVTCGDVVDQLSDYLQMRLRKEDYTHARPETQAKLKQAYHENRSPKEGVPGGRLGDGLKRLDWLGPNAMWGGIRRNDSFVKQKCGDVLPCVLELACLERPAVTQEDREEARRSRRRSRSTRRGSSAANSEGSH